MRIYYRQNSRVVEVPKLTDHEGTVVAGATVEATITLEDGSGVPGVSNPINLNHVGDGRYVGTVPPIDLADGSIIVMEVKAEYTDVQTSSQERMVVRNRGFSDPCGSF